MVSPSALPSTFRSRAAGSAVLPAAVGVLKAGWTLWRNRRQVRRLDELDDHLLFDIGLTRADLREACMTPLHLDPTLRLALMVHQSRARGSVPAARPTRRRP